MILGSKESKKINQAKQEEERGARHLNFKDISPLVKSSNNFILENGILLNEHTIEQNSIGKISQPQVQAELQYSHQQQNSGPKLILGNQQNAFTSDSISPYNFQVNQQQQQFSNTLTNYATELGSTLNNPNSLSYYNRQHSTHLHPFDFHDQGRPAKMNSDLSQEQLLTKEQMMMTNKLSSQMVESPPPLNDLTPEKGIKDFNRQYLGSGMWPHKPVQASLQGAIQEYSLMNSGIGDASLLSSRSNNNVANKMGEQLKRIENQMSSISKKMGAQHQYDRSSRDISDSKQCGLASQSHCSFEYQNERMRHQQNPRNHPLALSGQYQNGAFNTQQQNYYPGVDANIVQKISSTLDHMNNRFHFKRQSEQVPTMTNHFIKLNGPKERINVPNTMVNNTVFNQSSLDEICNTNYAGGANFDDISSNNQTNLQLTNELYYNNSQFNSIKNQPQQHIYQQQTQRQNQTNSINNHQVQDGQQQQLNTSLQHKYGLPQSNSTTQNKNTVNNSTISANNRSPNTTSSGPHHGAQTHTPISRNGQQQQQNIINIAQNSAASNIYRQSNNHARFSNVSDMNPVNNSTSSNTHNNSVINSNANTNPNSNYNTSSFVKQVTLNGFGLGTVNQRMNDTSATTNSMRITNPTYQTNHGMGMGTLGTLGVNGCSVGESQNFNTFENVIKNGDQNFQLQSLNNHPLLGNFSQTLQQIMDTNQSIQQQMPAYPHQGPEQDNHRRVLNQDGEECCQDCLFEREKRMVTQKAFERALGISLFLMEEIDKINLIEAHNQKAQDRPSTLTQSTGANKNPQLHFSRQDLTNILLDQTQYSQQTFTNIPNPQNQHQNLNQTYTIPHNRNLSSSPASDNLLTASGGAYLPLNTSNLPISLNKNIQLQKTQQMQIHQQSQTRLGRSKSQSLMPGEFQAMQKSLQLPRGIGLLHAVNQISGNNISHQRQIGQQPRLRVVEEERDERTGGVNRIFFENLQHNQQQNMTAYI